MEIRVLKDLGFCLHHHVYMRLTLEKIFLIFLGKYDASGISEMI